MNDGGCNLAGLAVLATVVMLAVATILAIGVFLAMLFATIGFVVGIFTALKNFFEVLSEAHANVLP